MDSERVSRRAGQLHHHLTDPHDLAAPQDDPSPRECTPGPTPHEILTRLRELAQQDLAPGHREQIEREIRAWERHLEDRDLGRR